MGILLNWLISTLAIMVTTYILPGVKVKGFLTAAMVAVILGIVNAVIKPILLILTLPINILTLGLFTFVIIGFLVMLVAKIVPGFVVDNFGWALLFALVLSIINSFLHRLA